MLSKRLVSTVRSTAVAGALVALGLAMSGSPAQASTPANERHPAGSPAFAGDAYDNERGITGGFLPEVHDEVLVAHGRRTAGSQTEPQADGIIAILIGAVQAPPTAPLGSTTGSLMLPYLEQDN
jgi:hypothetical protein